MMDMMLTACASTDVSGRKILELCPFIQDAAEAATSAGGMG